MPISISRSNRASSPTLGLAISPLMVSSTSPVGADSSPAAAEAGASQGSVTRASSRGRMRRLMGNAVAWFQVAQDYPNRRQRSVSFCGPHGRSGRRPRGGRLMDGLQSLQQPLEGLDAAFQHGVAVQLP